MNKAKLSVFISLFAIIFSACTPQTAVNYKLQNIYVDPVDIKVNYNNVDSSRLCFDVNNNAPTTLLSKVEVTFEKVGETCFQTIGVQKLPEIPPKESRHTCLDLRLPYDSNSDSYKQKCKDRKFAITVSLQDVTGVELDRGATSIGII